MWSDIHNKPKQGKTFCLFRGELINAPEDYDDEVKRGDTNTKLIAE